MTDSTETTPLTALALVCSLKPSPAESSSQLMSDQILEALRNLGVSTSSLRLADYDVKPGVTKDEGEGDEWPGIREQILAADILIVATPTWVGHMSSIAQRVLERLDNELGETDEQGRPILYDRVALAAIVGNEDGAHQITAELFQGLGDLGYTIPAQAAVYWNGEAMHTVDYKDLDGTPEKVRSAITYATSNAAHLARLLRSSGYPMPS